MKCPRGNCNGTVNKDEDGNFDYCEKCKLIIEKKPSIEQSPNFEPPYYVGPPCDCESSTCDQCNPGWEDEGWFDDLIGEENYGGW